MTLGECTLKMPREVLAALSSAPMTEAELLKLDKSALAEVLAGEGAAAGPSAERGGPEEGVDDLGPPGAGGGSPCQRAGC